MESFKKFSEHKSPNRYELYSSLKDECISEKDGHIGEEDYLHAVMVWNEFTMKS